MRILPLALAIATSSASVWALAAPIDTQLASVRLWLDKNRLDLAEVALDKALLIDPSNAAALLLRIQMAYGAGQHTEAEAALAVLATAHPDTSALAQAQAYRRLSGSDGRDFATAEVMARTGRGEAAVAMVKRIFPKGPPGGDLSLRYYRLLATVPSYWSVATDGLRHLVQQNPNQQHYRDALEEQLNSAEGVRRAQATAEVKRRHDPFAIAREAALRDLENDQLEAAEKALLALQQQRSNDEATLAGLGRLRMRQGRHDEAVTLFSQALRANNPDRRNELQSLKRTATFWASLARAREQRDAQNITAALQATKAALALQPHQADALNLQAQLLAEQGQKASAEAAWREALRYTPGHEGSLSNYLRWLVGEGRVADANALLAQAGDRPELRETLARVKAGQLRDEADAYVTAGNLPAAEASLRAAQREAANDPWLAFDLAKVLQRQQRSKEADVVMAPFAHAKDASSAYAYALFASSQDRLDDAEAALAALPTSERNESIERYAAELRLRRQLQTLAEATTLSTRQTAFNEAEHLSQGDPEASAEIAKNLLRRPHPKLPNGTAWMRERQAAADPQSSNMAWQFALADVLVVGNDPVAASAVLAPYGKTPQRLTNAQYGRFKSLQVDSNIGRGELAEAVGNHANAYEWFAQARKLEGEPVVDANALSVEPEFAKTAAERALTRNLKRLDGYVQTGLIYRDKVGTDGLSTTHVTEIPTEIYWPIGYRGHFIGHIDQVSIDAGTLPSNLRDQAQFGQVLAKSPTGITPIAQSADGVALGVGFETDNYRIDVGTTPIGFAVTSLVGGLRYSDADATYYKSLELFRRPVQSSVLSYAGTRDPVSGRTWGGVVRSGGSFRFSHSVDGRTRGIGGRAAVLTGQSVATNEELRLTLSQSH
ncbi:MAG: cellulose synthase subunit BcsC-related outer membrane protein, partial [Paraperlucidibaca sp.]